MSTIVSKHIKVYSDLTSLYKLYWQRHQNLPKAFRFSTGEALLNELSNAIRYVLRANEMLRLKQFRTAQPNILQAKECLEIVRGYLIVAWELKFISHAALAQISNKIDTILKQLSGWYRWVCQSSSTK
ncbi:TPA: four helix bundle protein [Vibrio parahaemolyticus]